MVSKGTSPSMLFRKILNQEMVKRRRKFHLPIKIKLRWHTRDTTIAKRPSKHLHRIETRTFSVRMGRWCHRWANQIEDVVSLSTPMVTSSKPIIKWWCNRDSCNPWGWHLRQKGSNHAEILHRKTRGLTLMTISTKPLIQMTFLSAMTGTIDPPYHIILPLNNRSTSHSRHLNQKGIPSGRQI